jgi:hypothetical protein
MVDAHIWHAYSDVYNMVVLIGLSLIWPETDMWPEPDIRSDAHI